MPHGDANSMSDRTVVYLAHTGRRLEIQYSPYDRYDLGVFIIPLSQQKMQQLCLCSVFSYVFPAIHTFPLPSSSMFKIVVGFIVFVLSATSTLPLCEFFPVVSSYTSPSVLI